MSSSVNNKDTSTSIISIHKVLVIVLVFGAMFYLLFPKNIIKETIKEQGENLGLSINYLENMLLYQPNNVKLEMTLLKKYTLSGERSKANSLIEKIFSHTNTKQIHKKLYKAQYLLSKKAYFEKGDAKQLKAIQKKLYHYFEYTKGESDYRFLFKEATKLDAKSLKYSSLKKLMKQYPKEYNNHSYRKDIFYLAIALGHNKEAYEQLDQLIKFPNVEKSLKNDALTLYVKHKDYKKALPIATSLFLESTQKEELKKYLDLSLYLIQQEKLEKKKIK